MRVFACINLDFSPVQLCSLKDRCVRVCRRAGASSATALTLPTQLIGLRKSSSGSANGGNNGDLSTDFFCISDIALVLKVFLDRLSIHCFFLSHCNSVVHFLNFTYCLALVCRVTCLSVLVLILSWSRRMICTCVIQISFILCYLLAPFQVLSPARFTHQPLLLHCVQHNLTLPAEELSLTCFT